MRIAINVPAKVGAEPEIKLFFDAMVHKLGKNVHKGKWQDLDLQATIRKLKEEVAELEAAVEIGNTVDIILEAADIANFALMAANIAVRDAVDGKKASDSSEVGTVNRVSGGLEVGSPKGIADIVGRMGS